MRWVSDLRGTLLGSFGIGRATISAGSLTAERTHALPDKSGTVALLSDVVVSAYLPAYQAGGAMLRLALNLDYSLPVALAGGGVLNVQVVLNG